MFALPAHLPCGVLLKIYLTILKDIKIKIIYVDKKKSLQHQEFPGGPPSKYYPGPKMLNFRDQTRTGVFILVWP